MSSKIYYNSLSNHELTNIFATLPTQLLYSLWTVRCYYQVCQLELCALPCGDCQEPVSISCLGNHEVSNIPCHRALPYACGRPCGRHLPCGNHSCSFLCHNVIKASNLQVNIKVILTGLLVI